MAAALAQGRKETPCEVANLREGHRNVAAKVRRRQGYCNRCPNPASSGSI